MTNLSRTQFKDIMRRANLSDKERSALEKEFGDDFNSGLSKDEIRNKIYSLKQNDKDVLSSDHLSSVRDKAVKAIDELESKD